MGSHPSIADDGLVPQHAEPNPDAARFAAAPYFSCTTALMFSVLIESSFSLGNRHNILRRDHPVPGAAFGVQKAEKILERVRIRAIPEERSLSADIDETLVFQLVEVVRQGGIGNFEFRLNVSND